MDRKGTSLPGEDDPLENPSSSMKAILPPVLAIASALVLCQCKPQNPPELPQPNNVLPEPGESKPAIPTEPSGEPKPGEVLTPGSGFPTGSGPGGNSPS